MQVRRERKRKWVAGGGTFQRYYRSNYRGVNCAEWEEEIDNEADYNGDWDTSDYHGGYRWSHVDLGGNENDCPSIELEFGDIEVWETASEVEHHLVNRSDAGRTEVRDALGAFPKTNSHRRYIYIGKRGSTVMRFGVRLAKHMGKYKRFRNN